MPKTTDQYLLELREKVDQLKARTKLPGLSYSNNQQDKIVLHFIDRAVQIGEACFRIADLRTPVVVLSRVLCEDFFRLFWILQSEENAAQYAKNAAVSAMAKTARVQLARGRAKVRDKTTKHDVTATILPQLSNLITEQKRAEQIANDSGLGKLYDIVYRFDSLEVHANTFGLFSKADDEKALLATFPAIIAFLQAVILVTDNRATTAAEILRHMRIDKVGGK